MLLLFSFKFKPSAYALAVFVVVISSFSAAPQIDAVGHCKVIVLMLQVLGHSAMPPLLQAA